MSAKILVADDSATIQKVVKITLAEEPFEVMEALGETELFAALRSNEIDLVLLDFNLSEDKTGYQLSEEVTKKYPNTSVMVMLGTFDTVDDDQLKKNGVQDKIVKPFDSQRFVEKCHSLVEIKEDEIDNDIQEELVEEQVDDIEDQTDDAGEQWVMEEHEEAASESVPVEDLLGGDSDQTEDVNPLEAEASDWQGEVPGVIGEESNEQQLAPEVIEDDTESVEEIVDESAAEEESVPVEEILEQEAGPTEEDGFDPDSTSTFRLEDIDEELAQKTPADEDLEYPETIAMYQPGSAQSNKPTSQLVSLDELAPEENDDEEDDDSTDPSINLEPNLELEREVEKEVSPDEFWAVDEEVEEEVETFSGSAQDVDYNKLADALRDNLKPFIENIIKDICTQNIEKISWEVIPDLAENLIKKELKEISGNLEE